MRSCNGFRSILPAAAIMAWAGAVHAGGINLNDEGGDSDDGPSFFGFVRIVDGPGVSDAKVTATVKAGGALVTRTNSLGVYKISGLGKDVDPDSVTISCAKDGYRQANVVPRSRAGADPKDPIEVECYLRKE